MADRWRLRRALPAVACWAAAIIATTLLAGASITHGSVEEEVVVDIEFLEGCAAFDGFLHVGPSWNSEDSRQTERLIAVTGSPDHPIDVAGFSLIRTTGDPRVALVARDGRTALFEMPLEFDVGRGQWVARAWLDCSTTPYRELDPILGTWLALVPLDREAGSFAFLFFVVFAAGGSVWLARTVHGVLYRWVMQP